MRRVSIITGLVAALATSGLLAAPSMPDPMVDNGPRKPRPLKRMLLAERHNVTYVTSEKPMSKRAKRRARGRK